MTLKADLDQMRTVAGHLATLGAEVTGLKFGPMMMGTDSAALQSVGAMQHIQYDVLNTTLIPSFSERLSETGEIMVNCADKFKNADDTKTLDMVTMFTNATGNWGE
ncbi:hypothetical protein [Mycobacterium aquaticum]|nr:hypothetical protein [Mycobacterium aquaticum]